MAVTSRWVWFLISLNNYYGSQRTNYNGNRSEPTVIHYVSNRDAMKRSKFNNWMLDICSHTAININALLALFQGFIKVTWLVLRCTSLPCTCWATLFPISLASLQGPRASFGFITQCCPLLIYHPCSAQAKAIWNSLAFVGVIFRILEM